MDLSNDLTGTPPAPLPTTDDSSAAPALVVTGPQADLIAKNGLPQIGDVVQFKVSSVSEDETGKTIGFDPVDDESGDTQGEPGGAEENPLVGGDKEDSLPVPGAGEADEGDGKGEQDDGGTEEKILGYKRPKKKAPKLDGKGVAKSLRE